MFDFGKQRTILKYVSDRQEIDSATLVQGQAQSMASSLDSCMDLRLARDSDRGQGGVGEAVEYGETQPLEAA